MSSETVVINKSVCRACLTFNELEMHLLFTGKLNEMFQTCTNLQLLDDDGLPNGICSNCVRNLNIAFSFKELCLKSNEILKTQNFLIKDELTINSDTDSDIQELDTTNMEVSISSERSPKQKKKLNRTTVKYKSKKTCNPKGSGSPQSMSERYPLKCTKCPSYFISQERYEGHLREHEGKKPAVCKICGKTYNKWHGLLQHMVLHSGEKKFVCHCGKDFYYNGAYKVHLKTHGGDEVKIFVCDQCGKGFRTNAELKHHVFSHTEDTPVKCTICPKSFKNNQCLRAHLQRHAKVKNHICPTCGKATVTPAELRIHMRTHTDLRPFSCNLCGKNFRVRSALTSHMMSHTGIKKYQCKVCNKLFTSSGSLRTHNSVHTGDKPHKCSICDRCFSQKSSLKTHMKVHSKETVDDITDNKHF